MLNTLTSLHIVTRRPVLQKVRDHAYIALSLLVSIGFQVLFHSPPGVLFTFPSRYYALSVTRKYLALGGGPPCFIRDFSCPVLLWIPTTHLKLSPTGLLPSSAGLSRPLRLVLDDFMLVHNPETRKLRFGLFPFRSPLLRKSMFLSFPPATEMFQFTGCPSLHYLFM